MTQEEGSSVRVGDILFHTIYQKKVVITKIIETQNIYETGDFQYRFEDKVEPTDTETRDYVEFIK